MDISKLQLLSWKQVIGLTNLSKRTIQRRIKAGSFPVPLDLGGNSRGWKIKDIEVWINKLEKVSVGDI